MSGDLEAGGPRAVAEKALDHLYEAMQAPVEINLLPNTIPCGKCGSAAKLVEVHPHGAPLATDEEKSGPLGEYWCSCGWMDYAPPAPRDMAIPVEINIPPPNKPPTCGGCRGDWSDSTALPEGWRDGACGLHLAAAHLRHALDARGGDAQAWGDHVVEAAERLLGEVWR